LQELGIADDQVDLRSNPSIRSAIWKSCDELKLVRTEIPLDRGDSKAIWENIEKQMPLYALFRSDRPGNDDDSEVARLSSMLDHFCQLSKLRARHNLRAKMTFPGFGLLLIA
jgi:hypothetical protein